MGNSDSFIRFRCPRCMGTLKAKRSAIGKKLFCPACYQEVVVPPESEPERRAVDPSKIYVTDSVPRDVREMTESFSYLEYRCPVCGAGIAVNEKDIGQKRECPDCGTDFSITADWFRKTRVETAEKNRRLWIRPNGDPNGFPVAPPVIGEVYELNEGAGPEKRPPVQVKTFPVHCPICGTLQYATPDQVGTEILCPDCDRKFVVRKPVQPEKTVPVPPIIFEGESVYGLETDQRLVPRGNVLVDRSPSSNLTSPPPVPPVPPTAKTSETSGTSSGMGGVTGAEVPDGCVPVVCSLCGTLMYAPVSMIGKKKKCPDCETETLILPLSDEERIRRELIEPTTSGVYDVHGPTGEGADGSEGMGTEDEISTNRTDPKEPVVSEPEEVGTYNLSLPDPPVPQPGTIPVPSPPTWAPPSSGGSGSFSPSHSMKGRRRRRERETLERLGELESAFRNPDAPSWGGGGLEGEAVPSELQGLSEVVRRENRTTRRASSRQRSAKGDPDDLISEVKDGRVHLRTKSPPTNPMFNALFAPMGRIDFWLSSIPLFIHSLSLGGCFLLFHFLSLLLGANAPGESAGLVGPSLGLAILVIFFTMAISMLFVFWSRQWAISFISIVLGISGGNREVTEWIEIDFVGGIFLALRQIVIFLFAATPGSLIGLWIGPAILAYAPDPETPKTLLTSLLLYYPVILVAGTTFFLFPIFWLSTYERDIFFCPISSVIWRSFGSCFGSWLAFFFWSFIVLLPLCLVINFLSGIVLFVILPLVIALTILFYAVILGRLGWVIEDRSR